MKPLTEQNHSNIIMTVTTKELSEILGLSSRRIQQLAKEKVIVRVAHGKYDLPHSIQSYIEYIKEQSKSDEEIDFNKERTLLTRANRMKAELELKIMQGELHRSEDVETVMNDMLSSFRAQMLVLPNKVAPLVLGQTNLATIKNIIKKYVHEALQELSDYDPHVFYEKSKDKISVDNDDIEEKLENQAEKGKPQNEKSRRKSQKEN